uniref:Uncharacterized protein n=1 Tax=viral metagenome TaxID=1070528 RepID=A0A2V0R971_9ZZZZ
MSQTDEQYKGKLPRPAKTQSIKEFEDEEIKPDPEYTEFNSVAEILAKPEYFKLIIEQPEFQAMLKREGVPNPLSKTDDESGGVEPKSGEKKGEQKEKKVEAEPDGSKADAEGDEPKTSIDVVMVPSLEEVAPVMDDTTSPEPSAPSTFEPSYRRVTHKVTAPVDIDVTHDLAILTKSGIEDLLVDYSGDRTTKKGAKFHAFLQQFRPMAQIEPLSYDETTGSVKMSNHAFVFGESVSGKSSKAHEYELGRVRPKIATSSEGTLQRLKADMAMPEELTNSVGPGELIDLALEPRTTGIKVKSADVIMNPARLPLMLRDTMAFRSMTMSYPDWLAAHGQFINPKMLSYVREKNAKERDVITNTYLKRSMYDRFVLGDMANNSQSYYFDELPNSRNYQICEGVLNRSLSKAMEAMSTLSSSQRSISTNITNRQASQMLLGMTSIQPSDGVNFARHLGAYLLGGKRRTLEVDIDDGATKTPLLNALCSFANLVLIDRRFLDDRSYRQLVVNVLLPFYDEFSIQRMNDATKRVERSRDVHDIANDLVAGRIDLPKVTKMVDTTGRGSSKAREIKIILTNLFARVMSIEYSQLNATGRMFETPAGAPFTPFTPRGDIVDVVLFGTRTDGFESRMHELVSYKPEALKLSTLVEEYADVLGKLRQFDGIGLAMSEAMKTKTHVTKSMAIFTDAFIHGSTHTELLPPGERIADVRSIDTVMLPFDGALSFLLYGIGSSEIAETTDAFVRFKSMSAPVLPSLYPVYLYVERAIVQQAFNEFSTEPTPYLITHREMVIDVCVDALKVYFTSVDPDSRGRISHMFDDSDKLERSADFDLPTLLTSKLFNDHEFTPMVGSEGQKQLPGSFDTNADIAEKNKDINSYTSALKATDRVVEQVFIDFEPISPTKIETYSSGSTLVYTGKRDKSQYISLSEIVTKALYIDSDTLSVDAIRNLAKAHIRREQEIYGNTTILGVYIDDVRTSFKFVEHKGLSDIVVDTPTITIDRNSRYLDTQFEVSEISVYYHRLTDRQGELSNAVIMRELEYLNGFLTYVSIDQDTIQKCLVNFDHADPMNPSIYKLGPDGSRVSEDSIAAIKLRDGRGVTYAGRVTLSTRESEEIEIIKQLSSKESFVP